MNTPAYFCFDNFGAQGTEVLPDKNVDVNTAVRMINNDRENMIQEIYNPAGQRIQKMQRGLNIINGKKYLVE